MKNLNKIVIFLSVGIALTAITLLTSPNGKAETNPFCMERSQLVPKNNKGIAPFCNILHPEKEVDVFLDKQGNEYHYDNEGKRVGFFLNQDTNRFKISPTISLKDIEKKSYDILSSEVDMELYTLCESLLDDFSKNYELTYYKMINGYASSDFIYTEFSKSGDMLSYRAPNIGCFDNIDVPDINEDYYLQQLDIHLMEAYGSDKIKNYEVTNKFVALNNEILEFELSYALTFTDGTKTGDMYSIKII